MSFLRRLLIQWWGKINSSYWFIPSLMTVGGVFLSYLLVWAGGLVELKVLKEWDWLILSGPDGARAVLSTLAGSTITVAGVVFSMTLLAVSHASSQIGPRILSGFMRDRGNQITLGTFIATFVYCLLVLRNVQGGADFGGDTPVPQLAVVGAMTLAFLSVAVLIYFIHHVPHSITMSNVVSRVGSDFVTGVRSMYPANLGDPYEAPVDRKVIPSDFQQKYIEVLANGKGYIRSLDSESLLNLATENDVIIEVLKKPGDFVSDRMALLKVYPDTNCDEQLRDDLRNAMVWGAERSFQQDALFSADLLVEVAARALSPGVNDPFTAKECICQAQAGLGEMLLSPEPSALRKDKQGNLRVLSTPLTFASLANRVFDSLRPYSKKDPIASEQIFKTLIFLKRLSSREKNTLVLDLQAKALWAACNQEMKDERDLENLKILRDQVLMIKNA